MTSFANIATLLFGTYDNDLGKRWVGDKMAQKIIDNNGAKGIKLNNTSIFGLGENLGIKEDVLHEVVKEKDEAKRLAAFEKAAGGDLVSKLQGNLATRYESVGGFKNVSFLDRFKTNFKEVRNSDPIYQLASKQKTAKGVFQEMAAEVKGAKGFLGKSGKVLGKSLPFIGAVLTLATEVPAIFKSFSNYGSEEGLKQTGRSALSIGGFAAGTAVGATIGSAVPVVGTIVGGIVGGMVAGWLGKTIFGKSKVEEAEEKQETVAQAQTAPQQAIQPSAFGTYSAPQAYTMPQAYQMPMFASRGGGISLGDENSMRNAMSTYRMSQMVA